MAITDATIKGLLSRASGHSGEMHVLYAVIVLGIAYGAGYWQCSKNYSGASEIENRQLADQLTEKERAIQAANLKIGKVETDLQTSEAIKAKLATDNAGLSETANELASKYSLKLDQYSSLKASFDSLIRNGRSGITDPSLVSSTVPECGKCKGQVNFGTYASCGWGDYAANTNSFLRLKLGVRLDSVSLRQQPKDGSLRAEISRAYLTADGRDIAEGTMDESSRVFTAPSLVGDLSRRHFYVYGGATPQDMFLGLFSQRGTSPFIYGAQINRPYAGGAYQPGVFLGWQLR